MSGPGPDLATLVRNAAERLSGAGVPSARVDAELLAAHVLGVRRGELVARLALGARLSGERLSTWHRLVDRRASREPLQHLTGTASFRRIELAVGPGVFVPRPETEVLVQAALDWLATLDGAPRPPLAVDLCTGSAAIALALADEHPTVQVVALELEAAALAWARRNVVERDAGEQVSVMAGDVRDAVADGGALVGLVGLADLVTANPPYIPDGALPVDIEVAAHDPAPALYGGGADGLTVPSAVLACAAALLRPGGLLLMEHGDVQGPATRALADAWTDVRTLLDLTGRERVLYARR